MKFAVNAGKAHIGHLIQLAQRLHYPVADLGTGHFAVKIPLQALADIIDQAVDIFRINGAI